MSFRREISQIEPAIELSAKRLVWRVSPGRGTGLLSREGTVHDDDGLRRQELACGFANRRVDRVADRSGCALA